MRMGKNGRAGERPQRAIGPRGLAILQDAGMQSFDAENRGRLNAASTQETARAGRSASNQPDTFLDPVDLGTHEGGAVSRLRAARRGEGDLRGRVGYGPWRPTCCRQGGDEFFDFFSTRQRWLSGRVAAGRGTHRVVRCNRDFSESRKGKNLSSTHATGGGWKILDI